MTAAKARRNAAFFATCSTANVAAAGGSGYLWAVTGWAPLAWLCAIAAAGVLLNSWLAWLWRRQSHGHVRHR